ncbi:hypothetical protein J6590_056134 [Homalodisca vitripennis]|nr:hypothetical protein J6590_056134 [Homalodisca vitripennis]
MRFILKIDGSQPPVVTLTVNHGINHGYISTCELQIQCLSALVCDFDLSFVLDYNVPRYTLLRMDRKENAQGHRLCTNSDGVCFVHDQYKGVDTGIECLAMKPTRVTATVLLDHILEVRSAEVKRTGVIDAPKWTLWYCGSQWGEYNEPQNDQLHVEVFERKTVTKND